jgi:hypothetical protein
MGTQTQQSRHAVGVAVIYAVNRAVSWAVDDAVYRDVDEAVREVNHE